MTSNEKPIILVVVTFFLALTLVYIVYFRIKSEKNESEQSTVNTTVTQSGSQFASSNFGSGIDYTTGVITTWAIVSGDDSFVAADLSPLELKIRSLADVGVKPLYSSISLADQLWLKIIHAFTDQYGVQYGYIGTGSSLNDLAPTVRRLWWNVLAIETRNDIMNNLLRWDRVSFVNIPGTTFVQQWSVQQRLLVAMIVQMGEDRWFIQSPIDQYYAHKSNMKSYFEKIYDKVW